MSCRSAAYTQEPQRFGTQEETRQEAQEQPSTIGSRLHFFEYVTYVAKLSCVNAFLSVRTDFRGGFFTQDLL